MPYTIEMDNPDCDGHAVVKAGGDVVGCHTTHSAEVRQLVALNAAEYGDDRDAPAPKEDQIKGSSQNEPGSASGKSGDIELDDKTVTALENKTKDHNTKMADRDRPSWTRVTTGALKAVYRRGSGAYSVSHRPGTTRQQWALARVNAFLFLSRTGAPANSKYVSDNDLLATDHPRYEKQKRELRADSFTPTVAMKSEAQQGLEWRREFGRGGTAVGVARARDIVNGRDLSFDTVKRTSAFFARHAVDKEAEGFRAGEDGYPSAGRIAWALWGGDAGRAWALAIIVENKNRGSGLSDEVSMETVGTIRTDDVVVETRDGDLDPMQYTPMQILQHHNDEDVVDLFGKYSQDTSADGAHYMPVSAFADEGLVCSSCAFYQGGRMCEIVEGEISPGGLCKRWIIPQSLIVSSSVEGEMNPMTEPMTPMTDMTSPMGDPAVRYGVLEMEHRKVQGRDVEFRTVSIGNIEVRAAHDDQPMTFRGYAAVFDSPSEPLPFTETIRTGAFKRSLSSGREVRMFVNHNTDMVLGSTRSGTLTVSEDSRGLLVEGEFPDTSYARDLSALMVRGDVHGMSFGFSVPRGGDTWSDNGAQRQLTEIILHEVSVVTGFPAYPGTSGATIRSAETDIESDETPVATVPVSVLRRLNDLYARKA